MSVENRMSGVLDVLRSDVLNAFPYRCAVMRNRNASCTRCAEACTSGAISLQEDQIVVDPALCVGCGTCATVCPTCALEANNPSDAELVAQAGRACANAGGHAVILCDRAWEPVADRIDPERAARVRCLGRVEESLLVGLVAGGATRVTLVHADCASCPRNAGCETYEMVVDTTDRLLETWNSPVRVAVGTAVPACARRADDAPAPVASLPYDETRRHLLGELGRAGMGAIADGVAGQGAAGADADDAPLVARMKVMGDGTLPHFLPDRRERLLDALAELGEPSDVPVDSRLWGHVSINVDACRTCFMCATFCPTGAIARFQDEDGTVGVDHTPADCVKCRCCTDVCPTGALTLREDVMAGVIADGGVVEHIVLPAPTEGRGGPHQIIGAMRQLLGIDQLYER